MTKKFDTILDCDFCINLGILRACMKCCGCDHDCNFYESFNTRLEIIENLEKHF